MSERRKHLLALAILAIIPTIAFIDVLTGTGVFYLRDVTTYHHPGKSLLRHIVLGGEFPYWNPWYSAGQPMAANPAWEVFYPLLWLILLPSFNFGFHLLAVIHIHIATFAMYALLRSMRLGRPASVFGGLSFGLGGVAISLLNLWPCLFSFAWLPLTALDTRRFLQTGSRRALATAAFFLGVQFVIGEPVTAFVTGILLGMYAVARGWRNGGPLRALRMVGAVALICVLALLVSSVQTIPAIDHFSDSVRSRGLDWQQVRGWSMPLIRAGELVFPHLLGFGLPDGGGPYWGAHLYEGKSNAFIYSIYGGLAIAAFAIAGVFARIRGTALFLGISVVSLLLAAGENTPLLRFLYDIGIAKTWRYPEKFTMLLGFASVVFAAVVLDRILRGDERIRRIAVRVALVIAGVAVLAATIAHLPWHARVFGFVFQTPGTPSERLLTTAARIWTVEVFRTIAFALLLAGVGRLRRNVWLVCLALFMTVDLGPLLFEIAPREDPSYYDPPAIVAAFDSDPDDTRLLPYAQWEGSGKKADSYVRYDRNLFWLVRNGLSPMIPAEFGIRTVFETDVDLTALLPTVDFSVSMLELVRHGSSDWLNIALSMSNGEYVSLYEKPELAYARAGGNLLDLQPVKMVRGIAYPRYYFARKLVSIRDRSEFVDLLSKRSYPRDVAFISAPVFGTATGVVRSWEETVNTATIDVEATGRAFLVMSVTPHKYWQVAIDGSEVEPLVANIGYQGVVVPPGRHTVTMRYSNPLIAMGAALSLATLVALLFIARSGSHPSPRNCETSSSGEPSGA